MLSSRAAAFSVKALLNPNSDKGKDSLQPFASPTKHTRRKHGKTKNKHGGDLLREECHGITGTGMGMEQDSDPRMLPLGTHSMEAQIPNARIFKGDDNRNIFDEEEELVDVENCMDSPGLCPSPLLPLGVTHPGITSPSYSPMGAPGRGGRSSKPYRNCDPSSLSTHYYPQAISSPSSSAGADWQMYTHAPSLNVDRGGGGGGGSGGGRGISLGSEVNIGHSCSGVTIQLLQTELWAKFNELGTEMIITKNGRRMFPVVKVGIGDLHPDKHYMIYLDMVAVDNRRYRYVYPSSRWMVAGTGEPLGEHPPYIHPDSPSTGAQWMAAPSVAFDRLKLTNNKTRQTKGQIILHSMQKYQPRVWVQEVDASATCTDLPNLIDINQAQSASFQETTFITVTAYQNQQITRLKIDSNPFAKGFRDTTKQKELLDRRLLPDGTSADTQSIATMPFMLPLGLPGPHHPLHMAGYSHQYGVTCPTSLSQYGLSCQNPPSQYHHNDPTTPAQFALNSPVSPPISPIMVSPQWYHDAMEGAAAVGGGGGGGGGGRMPWMPDMSGSAFYRSRSMPVLYPPYLPSLYAHPPHALDLTKRKEDT